MRIIQAVLRSVMTAFTIIIMGGCASYVTPGGGARISAFDRAATTAEQGAPAGGDSWIEQTMNKPALAKFPASIAVVRVQASGYCSPTATSYGRGAFSVITQRDIEKPEHFDRLTRLPMVRGIAPLNRLIIPLNLQSDDDLREAAARMRADVVLLYTLDTDFIERGSTTPIDLITLGTSKTTEMRVICTASAAFLDTRSGYVYGLSEGTTDKHAPRNAWKTAAQIDEFRRGAESEAFEKLVADVEKTWAGVVQEYAVMATHLEN